MNTAIWVRQVRRNENTGYITLRIQSETEHEGAKWTGPLHDYGVDIHVFYDRFGGDMQQLVDYLCNEHRAKIGRHQELTDKLTALVGKQIG